VLPKYAENCAERLKEILENCEVSVDDVVITITTQDSHNAVMAAEWFREYRTGYITNGAHCSNCGDNVRKKGTVRTCARCNGDMVNNDTDTGPGRDG